MTSRPTLLASLVLTLAMLGDSLLYAVLPLHVATFGISLAWAGVLLAANRIVRLAIYPFLPRLAAAGLRRFTIAAAALGALSTLMFAAGSGAPMLLASRLVWGTVFGALSLSAFAYATERPETAGARVGASLALRETGPLVSLTLGSAAVVMAGVRPVLVVFGLLSFAGVLVARRLPELRLPAANPQRRVPRAPSSPEWLSFVAGFIGDGIFPATIALILARSSGAGSAVAGAGALLALRRIAVILLAPASGRAADRFGSRIVTAAAFAVAAAGAWSIALGGVIAGAVLLAAGAAVITTTLPVSVTVATSTGRLDALARLAMARDAGAAAGPVVALLAFEAAGPLVIYALSGALLAMGAMWLLAGLRPLREVAEDSSSAAAASRRRNTS